MSSEVAKLTAGAVVVRDPFAPDTYHDAADVQSLIDSAYARVKMRREQFDALGDLAAASLDAVREMRRALEEDDATLKDYDGAIKEALLDASGYKPVIVQIKGAGSRIDPLSARGKIAAMVKELKAREDAEKIAAPKHTYFYAVTATDAEHTKLQAAMKKADAGFACVSPQKDAEWKTAAKLFGMKEV